MTQGRTALCVPDGPIRRRVDTLSLSASKLFHGTLRRDSADPVVVIRSSEPEIAIRALGDVVGINEWIGCARRIQLNPGQKLERYWVEPSDRVAIRVGKPQLFIRTYGDAIRRG